MADDVTPRLSMTENGPLRAARGNSPDLTAEGPVFSHQTVTNRIADLQRPRNPWGGKKFASTTWRVPRQPAHRERWVTEPSQVDRPLPHLTDDEASVYRDLVEDAFGPSVRLEQERIPMAVVADAVMN